MAQRGNDGGAAKHFAQGQLDHKTKRVQHFPQSNISKVGPKSSSPAILQMHLSEVDKGWWITGTVAGGHMNE